ncbi:ATP-binding cassette domain-containing protein, partial [Arthrobacter sp. H5]|uniref:sulfate/molybdate ABC transporter ATP-binding protein n=1 Tax=Arthrobacter sp. H5 TaxID=1267973 RepID=UPI000688A9A1
MSLTFNARVRARGFDLEFSVAPGETVAVMGPNGAGKSTLFGLIAGLIKADDGASSLAGRVLFDDRNWTPPHARGVAMLAQEALLFPHLSVLDNVAFGPRSAGASRAASRQAAQHWLSEVEALNLAEKRPAQLSGGQAQRVAVARALAAEPRLLLLDEPMASLDIAVTPALRRTLRRVLEGRSAVIVTHNVLDALMLADRVVVLDKGRIIEEGPTRAVLEQPRSTFAAGLAGLNMLTGTTVQGGLATPEGIRLAASA